METNQISTGNQNWVIFKIILLCAARSPCQIPPVITSFSFFFFFFFLDDVRSGVGLCLPAVAAGWYNNCSAGSFRQSNLDLPVSCLLATSTPLHRQLFKKMKHIFLVVFLLLLVVVHNVQAQFFSSSKSTDESVLNLEANAEKVLDGTEHVLNRAWKWTTKHRQVS